MSWRIVAGGILVILGLGSVVSADVPFIWTGGIVVGLLFLVRGLNESSQSRRAQGEIRSILGDHRDELFDLLARGRSLDSIATHFSDAYQIPPVRTILVAAHVIKTLAHAKDRETQNIAKAVLSMQEVDSGSPPQESIRKFNFNDYVYHVDNTVSVCRDDPRTAASVEGTLILTKGHLYFFTKESSFLDNPGLDRALDRLAEKVPVVGVLTAGYSLFRGLSHELTEYFDEGRHQELERRFHLAGSFAVPLVEISNLAPWTQKRWLLRTRYMKVTAKSRAGNSELNFWCKTTTVDESAWLSGWIDRIQLACIAEGELLYTLPKPTASSSANPAPAQAHA